MTENQIIAKIRKLQALSQSSNQHEAAAAAARAQELMERHRISEAVLQIEEPHEKPPQEMGKEVADKVGRQRVAWKARLLHELSKTNSCRCLVHYGVGEMQVYGGVQDVQTVLYMYRYLCREVDRLAKEALKRGDAAYTNARTWANAFRFGCVVEIGARMQEAKQGIHGIVQREAYAKGGENALVLVNQGLAKLQEHEQNVHQFYRGQVGKTTKIKAPALRSRDGYAAGREAGRTVDISTRHTGLGAGSRSALRS